ncbi:MAG: carboxymuconolactone decarboxylase family protein [Idiomarina sp.]
MAEYKLHDKSSAPEKSKTLLENSEQAFGMIPNLHAVMAESPELLEGYQKLHELFQNTRYNADELSVVWLSISAEHECRYCMAAHTGIAKSTDVSDNIISALRNGEKLPNDKLEALRSFTLTLVRNRGHASNDDLQAFHDAGYDKRHVLEIVVGIAQKVMSNYTNHLAATPVDKPFEKFSWEKK